MKLAETRTIAATIPAAGAAIKRYAILRSGWMPRSFAANTTAQIPSSKLIANDSNDTTIVTSNTRIGMKYQRGARPPLCNCAM